MANQTKMLKYALRILPDSIYLKLYYFTKFKRPLNLKNPKSFNEKLQWLKLNDRNPLYTVLVDKIEAKKYVANIIGEEYIIPTLGEWNDPDKIILEQLPDQFVLKCNHGSGDVFICKDKSTFDFESAKKKLKKLLKEDYYLVGREWPYRDVNRKVFAEKYIQNTTNTESHGTKSTDYSELSDYKFMCFNGNMRCSFVCTERYSPSGLKVTFFDRDWNELPFERTYPRSEKRIQCPENYEKMVNLAEILSQNISFVRVDFYESDGKIYFGELTFYPGCGFEKFNPDEWDYNLGDWIDLSKGVYHE